MTPQQRPLRELFEAAIDLPAEQRAAFLDAHAAPEQRALLERMLSSRANAGSALPAAPAALLAEALADADTVAMLPPGSRIGPFELVEVLGQGGSSTVFRAARESEGVRQEVALKLLHRGLYSPEAQRQFRRERVALAQLRHPGIARLIEGGVTETGLAYIALELVEGTPITDYARARRLNLSTRLRLFVDVCRAVDAAHRALIVHRDLKPGNVLVTAEGSVKLLDFGIAKLLGDDNDTHTQLPAFTPAYASPEQRGGGMITTATDVYGLGVLLGELLTGERMAGNTHTPSSLVRGDTGEGTLPAPAPLARRQLRGDLDNIVLKALAVDPAARYASAGALADDVERFLDGKPVAAHPPSAWYRTRKFVARHKGGVLTTGLFLLAILAALGFATWQARVARQQARAAHEQAVRADAVQKFLVDIFQANSSYQSDPVKARATTAQQLLDIGAKKIDGEMQDVPDAKIQVQTLLGNLYGDLGLDDESGRLFRKAVDVARAAHGEYAPQSFEPLIDLADDLHSTDSDQTVKALLEQAQAVLDRNHDQDTYRRARLLDQWSQYYGKRDVPLSLDYAHKAVALYARLPLSADFTFALSREARSENAAGLAADSIASYKRAIEVSRVVDGDPNPDLPRYYAELSGVQYFHQDIADAERNGREALQEAKALHGENHVDVIQCEMRLGRLLADTGRTREGMQLLAAAKRQVLVVRGPDDGFHTPQVLFQNGILLIRAGRLEDGLRDVEAAVANRRRNRPGTTPLAQFLEVAASAEIEMGRLAQAAKDLDEAQGIRSKAGQKLPSQPFDENVVPRIRLALAQARYDRAAALLRQLSVPKAGAGLDLQSVYNALLTAEVELAAGKPADAIALAGAERGRIEASKLAVYYRSLVSQADFIEGSARLREGDARAATLLLEKALAERKQSLDPASPRIAEAQVVLAESRLAEGDVAHARELAAAASSILDSHKELSSRYRESLQHVQAELAHRGQ
jgi:serine/threonine-protein kinase